MRTILTRLKRLERVPPAKDCEGCRLVPDVVCIAKAEDPIPERRCKVCGKPSDGPRKIIVGIDINAV